MTDPNETQVIFSAQIWNQDDLIEPTPNPEQPTERLATIDWSW